MKAQGKHRYEEVSDALLSDLMARVYKIGDLLPTEAELCARFDISRHTARSALKILESKGLIRRIHGVGSKVVSTELNPNYFVTPNSVSELLDFARSTRLTKWNVASVAVGEAPDDLGEFDASQDLVAIEALRVYEGQERNNTPLSWMRIYIIEAYAGVIAELPKVRGALGGEIERLYGEEIVEIVQKIEAINIDEDVAAKLGVAPGHAGLKIRRAYVGKQAGVFEVGFSIHPAGRFTVVQHLRRGQSPQ